MYKFEDFIEPSAEELPADAPRLDVFEREVNRLKEQVSELESLKSDLRNTEEWIEDWFRKNIVQLADAAAREFAQQANGDLLVAALEKAGVQQKIEQAVIEQVHAKFEAEANELFKAILAAVMKRLRR